MKEICAGELCDEPSEEGTFSLLLGLRRAPRLFRLDRDDDMRFAWSSGDDDPDAGGWVRTNDPLDGVLGRFRSLRLVFALPPAERAALVNALTEYHLVDAATLSSASSFSCGRVPEPLISATVAALLDALPVEVRYEVEVLLGTGTLHELDLSEELLQAIATAPSELAVCALRQMGMHADHARVVPHVTDEFRHWCSLLTPRRGQPRMGGLLPAGWVEVMRVVVTPLRAVVVPAEQEMSNRVLRQLPAGCLIRVSFADEGFGRLSQATQSLSADVEARVRAVLRGGLRCCGREYEFLTFSSSQLKQHSCWFLARDGARTADSVRASMGDFSAIGVAGKVAARMGQCFSTTQVGSRTQLQPSEWAHVPDVHRNGYCFSDGVGTISPALVAEVAATLRFRMTPSAMQIRIGGTKGVLSVDPRLAGRKICTRPSMEKFPSAATDLEVCHAAAYRPFFLNRQLITVLSTRGVRDEAFEALQHRMVCELDSLLASPAQAAAFLRRFGRSSGDVVSSVCEILEAGLTAAEPFVGRTVHAIHANLRDELRSKGRILVPEGCALMGVMDELGVLEEGTVFVQIQPTPHVVPTVRTGSLFVAKNPCLHAGDVLALMGVDVPELAHLVNVVVFPQRGARPHPNETSGGDLDGDLYVVCWDEQLLPTRHVAPMQYSAVPRVTVGPTPVSLPAGLQAASSQLLARLAAAQSGAAQAKAVVTIEDVQDFFLEFIRYDTLGQIAHAHLARADQSSQGGQCVDCIRLADLHSRAVDFPKTGLPVEFPRDLVVHTWPDFMQKKGKEVYASRKVLGKLFRALAPCSQQSAADTAVVYDDRLEEDGYEKHLEDAFRVRSQYNFELASLMNQFGVMDEGEAVTGHVTRFYRQHTKARRDFDGRQQLMNHVNSLQRWARSEFDDAVARSDEAVGEARLCIASAWYWCCYHPDAANTIGFVSMPWVVHDHLLQILRRRAADGNGMSIL